MAYMLFLFIPPHVSISFAGSPSVNGVALSSGRLPLERHPACSRVRGGIREGTQQPDRTRHVNLF